MKAKTLKQIFKSISWWEYTYMSISFCIVLVLGIVFNSGALIILNSILGISSLFLVARGSFVGHILEMIQLIFYCTLCYFNRYFGEIITCSAIWFPTSFVSMITWIRNRKEGTTILSVNKALNWKEWVAMFVIIHGITFGMYFLLEYLNDANLILSTIGVGISLISRYLSIRRSEMNFLFMCIGHFITLGLWVYATLNMGGLSYLPTIANYIIYIFLDVLGFLNWVKLKKMQNLRRKKAEERRLRNQIFLKNER